MTKKDQLSLKHKIGYGLGDAGGCMTFDGVVIGGGPAGLAAAVSAKKEGANKVLIVERDNAKLENLERMKSDFISIVSHELRTPLTAIKNSLEIFSCFP